MIDIDPATPPADAPVFVLSFNQRDELAAAAAGVGWRIVAARRGEGVESRFLTSGAAVAVIDARGALSDGLIAARALGHVVETNGAAMLILVSQSDTVHMRQFYDAGATHFLSSPMSTAAISQAIRFALRHVERLAGGVGGAGEAEEPLGWHQDGDVRTLSLTPALASLLGLEETPRLRDVLRLIDPRERRIGRAAMRRLDERTPTTAFAHELEGRGRVVQHLQRDPATGRLSGLVERLGEMPDAGAVVREALSGTRDGPGARRWIDRRLGEGASVATLLIALSRFEMVNTAYGRTAGDAVLRAVSRRLSDSVRGILGRRTVVARLGGSEFLVASDDADAGRLEAAARKLDEALARPFVVDGAFLPLGARMALATSVDGDTAASLLRRASETLVDGSAARVMSGPSLDELAAALRHAIDRGEIGVLFQPQVSIARDVIVGVEALARWQHPDLG
ncbi:MAG: diguanylate cyclase, partial [Sphingomonas sp.]